MKDRIRSHFVEARLALETFLSDENNLVLIEQAAGWMVSSFKQGGKVISCGNGGSMSDAMHFAEELTGKFRNDRQPLPAVAISDPGFLSCVGNDYGYDEGFSRFVAALGNRGDVLLAISTSGNSPNVLKAAETARSKGMKVVALTGKDGGRLAGLADLEIRAPQSAYADRAQEIHIKVIHALIDCIEQTIHG